MVFMVYFETGRLPLYFTRIFRLFKFWFKMMQSENCILRASYECLYRLCENSKKYCSSWVSFIKEQLHCLGLGYIWNDQNCINSHVCLPIIRQRLKDHFIQNLQSKIQCEAKCYMYKYLVDNFCLQFYLEKSIPKLYKKCITKIRVSSHNLCIESDRHKKISRDKKFCMTCISTIEDEYQYLCAQYIKN